MKATILVNSLYTTYTPLASDGKVNAEFSQKRLPQDSYNDIEIPDDLHSKYVTNFNEFLIIQEELRKILVAHNVIQQLRL